MEAKLATMAKTKPADENYVPGLRHNPQNANDSGPASPAPEMDLEDEEMLGEEEAVKAADELQRELDAEFGDPAGDTVEGQHIRATAPGMTDEQRSTLDLPAARISPVPPPLDAIRPAGLPPRPNLLQAAPPSLTPSPANARSEEIKRGLAGLPKRPTF